ncbi:MAG: TonB family protein [Candidatus Acidiferrales bacterium]
MSGVGYRGRQSFTTSVEAVRHLLEMLMKINPGKALILIGVALSVLLNVSAAPRNATSIQDKDINVVYREDLPYPVFAQMNHIQGLVVVRVTLDETGRVLNAEALSGASILVQDTLKNIVNWRFSPNAERAAIIVYNFRIGTGCRRKSPYSQTTFYPPNFVTIINCRAPVWVP